MNKAIGDNWKDVRKKIFTSEEIAECDLKVAMISELIRARKDRGLTQKQLEEISGVKQPIIARAEKGSTSTQINTMLRILAPLGKTLKIVDINTTEAH